jgi:hypothetical protein
MSTIVVSAIADKIWTVIIVLLLLGGIGAAAGGGSSNKNNSSSSSGSSSSSSAKATAKLNEPARDGKFEFTISKVTCGEAKVGTNQYLTKTAQGQYCRVSMSIKNIGNQAQGLSSSDQKLIDAQGKEYSADDTATLYAAPEGATSTWYNQINPGNSVSGDIIFDIPKDVTPVTAELHDSAFSGGVKVNLQ